MVFGSRLAAGCLYVLGTCVSGLGQTIASEIQAPRPQVVQEVSPQQFQAVSPREFVDARLALWRERLKLEDWRISAVMTRRSDLAPKTLGGIRWDKTKKTAIVFVLDPADYNLPFPAMLDDMELTVVHELVHLELATAAHHEASRSVEEHAVNGIAEAMLALDRKNR
jgi:hypothetical protein